MRAPLLERGSERLRVGAERGGVEVVEQHLDSGAVGRGGDVVAAVGRQRDRPGRALRPRDERERERARAAVGEEQVAAPEPLAERGRHRGAGAGGSAGQRSDPGCDAASVTGE